jgi:hypothetical protein
LLPRSLTSRSSTACTTAQVSLIKQPFKTKFQINADPWHVKMEAIPTHQVAKLVSAHGALVAHFVIKDKNVLTELMEIL